MKLYYSPGTCSLSPHILLREVGADFSLENVDLSQKRTASGQDLYSLNGKGRVPVLELADGRLVTEGAVISQFIIEHANPSATSLLPASGDPERYRILEWQAFVATELHKSFSPLFNPAVGSEAKAIFSSELRAKYEWLNGQLTPGQYLAGPNFSVADAYLFAVTRWTKMVGVAISDLVAVQALMSRIGERPAVKAALEAEGLTS